MKHNTFNKWKLLCVDEFLWKTQNFKRDLMFILLVNLNIRHMLIGYDIILVLHEITLAFGITINLGESTFGFKKYYHNFIPKSTLLLIKFFLNAHL